MLDRAPPPDDETATAGVNLEATNTIRITTRVDGINGDVCTLGGDFYFELNTQSKVTLRIEGVAVTDVPDPRNETQLLSVFDSIDLSAGTYHTLLSPKNLGLPGEYSYTLTAVNAAGSFSTNGTIILSKA